LRSVVRVCRKGFLVVHAGDVSGDVVPVAFWFR
jgi:hypothetical protein